MVWCICLCSNNANTKSSHLHSQMHSNKDKNTSQISQCTRNKHNRSAKAQHDFLNKCSSTFFSLCTMACILITKQPYDQFKLFFKYISCPQVV
jgi:hypothetical protein